MKTIGIRDLKARLSSVLRGVARGDVYLVTDRGRVVAELRSPGASAVDASPARIALARLASTGQLRRADHSPVRYQKSPLSSPSGTARKLIDQGRGE